MSNKTLWGSVLAIVVLVLVIWWVASRGPDVSEPVLDENGNPIVGVDANGNAPGSANYGTPTPYGTPSSGSTTNASGRVVFMVTDDAAKMGDVSEVTVKISKVEVRNQLGVWVTASSTARSFNLLDLKAKNQNKVLMDVNLKHGTYDQIRLTLDSVSVKLKTGATKTATLPGKLFTIGTKLIVTGTPSMARLDFIADESLHLTTTNDYVFAPVIVTESQSGVALTIDAAGVVSLQKGEQQDIGTEGMDVDGSVKASFKLDPDLNLTIGADGKVKIVEEEKPKGVILGD
jgi:hypothetical protein